MDWSRRITQSSTTTGERVMSREVKRFMEEKGYSGWVDRCGIRKDYRRRADWQFKTLEHVLDEYRVWKKKQNP